MSGDTEALWRAIGWTMLHFLWVGGLIGIVTAIALAALRRGPAELRYAAAMGGLALLAAAPAAIYRRACLVADTPSPRIGPADRRVPATPPQPMQPPEDATPRVGPERAAAEADAEAIAAVAVDEPGRRPTGVLPDLDALASRLPWLWLAGSPLTFLWLAMGLAGAERLRRHAAGAPEGELACLCRRLAADLGIARHVAVAACDRLAGPVLVGIVRPMILLPASALGGWSPEQLEMVLLHELAHVRRRDNAVNLIQRLVESALFFHPAVWIVSGWVRREREHCCDGIVVRHTGRARAYAETLLALAGSRADRAPIAAASMARHNLVGRVRRILEFNPEGHAMKLHRGLLALTAILLTVPAGVAISRAPAAAPPAGVQARAPEQAEAKEEIPKGKPAAAPAARIEGKTVDEWRAAIKDDDPAVRKQAVEILGERILDPASSVDEKSSLLTAIMELKLSDDDPHVREAAAFFEILRRTPRIEGRLLQVLRDRKRDRKNDVKPTRMTIRLVDDRGRPVSGAVAGTSFRRDADKEASFNVPEWTQSATSDARGELALTLSLPGGGWDAAGIYAIRQDQDRPLVGLNGATRDDIRQGKTVTIVMHPACRVRMRVECPKLGEIAEKYHAELGGETWWRAAYVYFGEDQRAQRLLFTSSTDGRLEFLLPPGKFLITAYGSDTNNAERIVEVTPGNRLLNLGVVEVAPSEAITRGIFRDYWRTIRRDADAAGEESISFRRPRSGIGPKGGAREARDVAYSPDGTLLATAHWYDFNPGEVKLWDAKTGDLVARLPIATKNSGVLALEFSPDGKILAGSVGTLPSPRPGVVVLWDVAGRRELKTLEGHSSRITALAFSPDGKALASGGEDRTVRLWDVAGGKETRRIDGNPGWVRSLAYSPDGQTLAIGGGETVKLWDVPGDRLGATLEPGGFWAQSVAFAPDGRTLAATGLTVPADKRLGVGQVRLFALALKPPARRATLTIHHEEPDPPKRWMSDVAFTPDGKRVVGVAMQTIAIWDSATGAEQESLDRQTGSSEDRLAISPDGRWLAVTQPGGEGVSTFEIGATGR